MFVLSLAVIGCGEAPPLRYPLPATVAVRPTAVRELGDGVRITFEPVTESRLARRPELAVPISWSEPPVSPTLRVDGGKRHARLAALVPLPALWMTIENHGPDPLQFGCTQLALTTGAGAAYRILTRRNQVEAVAVERLLAEEPSLRAWRTQQLATQRDPTAPLPVDVVREALAHVPLFDPSLVVPPGGRWVGAVAFEIGAADIAALEKIVGGGRLEVHLACAQAGDRPLPPASFAFTLAPKRQPDGACLEEHAVRLRYGWPVDLHTLDGKLLASSEVSEVLLAQPVSRDPGRRVMALKGAGIGLVAAGILGSVLTAAVLGSTGHAQEAPAGLALLGLSGVGGVMTWYGHKAQHAAITRFNARADETGVCPRPR